MRIPQVRTKMRKRRHHQVSNYKSLNPNFLIIYLCWDWIQIFSLRIGSQKDKPKEEEENKDQETGKENGTKEAVGDGEDEEVIFWGKSKVRQINLTKIPLLWSNRADCNEMFFWNGYYPKKIFFFPKKNRISKYYYHY